jgi:hypothetical protein
MNISTTRRNLRGSGLVQEQHEEKNAHQGFLVEEEARILAVDREGSIPTDSLEQPGRQVVSHSIERIS